MAGQQVMSTPDLKNIRAHFLSILTLTKNLYYIVKFNFRVMIDTEKLHTSIALSKNKNSSSVIISLNNKNVKGKKINHSFSLA